MRVESFTDPVDRLLDHRTWQLSLGDQTRSAWVVIEGKAHGKGLIVRLEGVSDCDAAARLRGAKIEVARDELPPTRRREHYQIDLIGLTVINAQGVELGIVREFVAAPGQALMVVAGAKEFWVPAVREHLLKVDWDAGVLHVSWPVDEAAGG